MKQSTRWGLLGAGLAILAALALVLFLKIKAPPAVDGTWYLEDWSYTAAASDGPVMSFRIGDTGYMFYGGSHEFSGDVTWDKGAATVTFGTPVQLRTTTERPDNELAYEQGFLDLLVTVTDYGFRDGHLCLTTDAANLCETSDTDYLLLTPDRPE
jgi:hypothetical protein